MLPYPLKFQRTTEAWLANLLLTAPPCQDAKERMLLGDVSSQLLEKG